MRKQLASKNTPSELRSVVPKLTLLRTECPVIAATKPGAAQYWNCKLNAVIHTQAKFVGKLGILARLLYIWTILFPFVKECMV